MAEKIKIAELDIDIDKLLTNSVETQKQMETLRLKLADLKKQQKENIKSNENHKLSLKELELQGKGNSKEANVLRNSIKTTNAVITEQAKRVVDLNAKMKTASGEYNAQTKIIQAYSDKKNKSLQIIKQTDGSLNQISKALSHNKKAYSNLSKEERDNEKIGGKLLTLIQEQDKEYKDLNKSMGNNQVEVGNYQNALGGLAGRFSVFGVNIGRVTQNLSGFKNNLVAQKGAMKGMAKATSLSSKALKVFKIALISTGIGAIVVVLETLIAAFASTQKGIDLMNKALAPIKGAFQAIIGVVQKLAINVFGQLGDSWTILSGAFQVGINKIRILWNKLTGDFKEADELLAENKATLNEMEQAQERLNQKNKDLLGIVKNAGKEISKGADAQSRIAQLTIDIENSEINLVKTRAKLIDQIKQEELIAKNTSLSAKERNDASERAKNISENLLKLETNLLDKKIEQKTLEQSLNDTSREEKKELAELEAQRIQKQSEQRAIELNFLSTKKALNTELANEEKKAIDNAIKTSQTRLDIYIEESQGKAKTLEDEIKYENEVAKRKLNIAKKELTNKKITQDEFRVKELQIKREQKEAIANIEEEASQKELEKLEAYQNNRKELLESKRLEAEEEGQERDIIKLEIEYEKREEELANLGLNKEQETELLTLLEEQEGQRLAEIKEKYKKEDFKKEQDLAKKRRDIRNKAFDDTADLFGRETKLGKAALALKQLFAAQEMILEAKKTLTFSKQAAARSSVSLAEGTANTAKIGFPQNIPMLIGYAVQAAGIISALSSAVSSSKNTPKFEQGGLMEIGGKRHAQGGTTFVGDDGTIFEAEKGELIGVMNRNASRMFMGFNNLYNSGTPQRNYFANGGIVDRKISYQKTEPIDYDLLASKIGDANRQLPPPVTLVEDIVTATNDYNEIQDLGKIE